MPYNPNRWVEEVTDEDWSLQIECVPGQIFLFHGDRLRAPGFITMEDRVAFALRQVCHLLIDQIDNQGLEEVCRSLGEFYMYYRPAEHQHQLPEVRTKTAKLSSRTTSPAFEIGEE